MSAGTFYTKLKKPIKSTSQDTLKESNDGSSDDRNVSETRKTRKRTLTTSFFSSFCIMKNSNIITSNNLGLDSIEPIHGMRYFTQCEALFSEISIKIDLFLFPELLVWFGLYQGIYSFMVQLQLIIFKLY